MTLVGHSIIGLTLGSAFVPRAMSRRAVAGFLVLTTAMALLPDWRVPFHRNLFKYYHHHSLLVNAAIIGLIAVALGATGALKSRCGRRTLLCMTLAVLSHLVLDATYSHGLGVNISWPFGKWRLVLPLPWLHVQSYPNQWDWSGVRIRLVEALTFGPLLAGAAAVRLRLIGKSSAERE